MVQKGRYWWIRGADVNGRLRRCDTSPCNAGSAAIATGTAGSGRGRCGILRHEPQVNLRGGDREHYYSDGNEIV